MSTIRLPLLYGFAGGCLSCAVLFGVWSAAQSAAAPAVRPPHASRHSVELVTPPHAPANVEPTQEPVAAEPVAAAPPAAPELDSAEPAPAGSAISDVLTRLESAYREQVAARAPVPTPPTQQVALAVPPPEATAAPVVAATAAPAPPVAPAAQAVPVAAPVPVLAAREPEPPPVAAAPAYVAQNAPPPSQVHYGDVNQNTYITNVRQGDVYLVQMQQLAMLQYMMGMSSGVAAPIAGRNFGGGGHQRFPSGITNPDNPWGFHFSPPNLVR